MDIRSLSFGNVALSSLPENRTNVATTSADSAAANASVTKTNDAQNTERDTPVSKEALNGAVQKLQDFVAKSNSELTFSVDESSGTNVVQVIDPSSNEVIRQIPSKEAIAISQAIDRLQGLLVRDKA